MSQFYKSEDHKIESERYRAVLEVPAKRRAEIVRDSKIAMDLYTNGGSTADAYAEALRVRMLYSRTDEQLAELIEIHEIAAKKELVNELARCREWLISAFELKKQAKAGTCRGPWGSEHNIQCARSWVRTYWPQYKAARKMVYGY